MSQGSIDSSYNSTYNGFNVQLQDQTSEIVDLYMCKNNGTTSLSTDATINALIVSVVATTGAVVGDCINISENGRTYQGVITSIDTLDITVNAPIDQAFTTDAVVCFGEWDLSTASASTSAQQTFIIQPPAGAVWDITRMFFSIVDTGSFTSTTFGAIAGGLTNGIILRVTDGYEKNVFSIYNNAGFRERAFDVEIDTSGFFGSGINGLTCRRTFAGQDKNGVVIRLDGDTEDKLEIIVQDDLTDLDKFAIVVQGHTVEG